MIRQLSWNHFTTLKETPWAGSMINKQFKKERLKGLKFDRIGESWQFSMDPKRPSTFLDNNKSVIGELDPSDLTIKALSAKIFLSVQVHPENDFYALKSGEGGKAEGWYIIDAKPGAGVYLGFTRKHRIEKVREALKNGNEILELLNFVPVKKGDFINIPAGLVHSFGPDILALEPQRVPFGHSGKTYRLWDFNRKYLTNGTLDNVRGQPRELHTELALEAMDFTLKSYPMNQPSKKFTCAPSIDIYKREMIVGVDPAILTVTKGKVRITSADDRSFALDLLCGDSVYADECFGLVGKDFEVVSIGLKN